MIATIEHPQGKLTIDLSNPIDLSIPIHGRGPRAWYADAAIIKPVINRYFTGSVALGGNVNFNDIYFNPHAHGTHTETVGHIARELISIENSLSRFWWLAKLISITPSTIKTELNGMKEGDSVITLAQIQDAIGNNIPEALIIRTIPNEEKKLHALYSNTNFTYMEPSAAEWLVSQGVEHLLVDMPSIDREEDEGKLLAHHAFWNYPNNPRLSATITEMIFAKNDVPDGIYLLNLQVSSFRNDAAPSRPVIYQLLNT
jgi:kynurenine formamidase